jgi:hypothetical protein
MGISNTRITAAKPCTWSPPISPKLSSNCVWSYFCCPNWSCDIPETLLTNFNLIILSSIEGLDVRSQYWSGANYEVPTLSQLLAFKDQYVNYSKGLLLLLRTTATTPFMVDNRSIATKMLSHASNSAIRALPRHARLSLWQLRRRYWVCLWENLSIQAMGMVPLICFVKEPFSTLEWSKIWLCGMGFWWWIHSFNVLLLHVSLHNTTSIRFPMI